jgi:trans-AT polyketide synthase/acyltransferase/oxidoreductase domain-containing protein
VDFSGHEARLLKQHPKRLRPLLEAAEEASGRRLLHYLSRGPAASAPPDFDAQYVAFAFSCGSSELFREEVGPPDITAGYSMGIYAAAQASGAFSFETGLGIVGAAYEMMARRCKGRRPAMGGVIGLAEEDVRLLLAGRPDVEIANVNNPHSLVVTGEEPGVRDVLDAAQAAGALSVRTFPASLPYHHRGILGGVSEQMKAHLMSLPVEAPRVPLLSSAEQTPARTSGDVIRMLARNLDSNLRWIDTVGALGKGGARLYVEPGPGLSLTKIGRFLPEQRETANLKTLLRTRDA